MPGQAASDQAEATAAVGANFKSTGNRQEAATTTATSVGATEAVLERLTCGINETINECGRACEPSCTNVCAFLIVVVWISGSDKLGQSSSSSSAS